MTMSTVRIVVMIFKHDFEHRIPFAHHGSKKKKKKILDIVLAIPKIFT